MSNTIGQRREFKFLNLTGYTFGLSSYHYHYHHYYYYYYYYYYDFVMLSHRNVELSAP